MAAKSFGATILVSNYENWQPHGLIYDQVDYQVAQAECKTVINSNCFRTAAHTFQQRLVLTDRSMFRHHPRAVVAPQQAPSMSSYESMMWQAARLETCCGWLAKRDKTLFSHVLPSSAQRMPQIHGSTLSIHVSHVRHLKTVTTHVYNHHMQPLHQT